MPDFAAPVAGRNSPNDGMTQLSNLMGVQLQGQQLQTGKFTQQTAQATAQNAQQQMSERQILATMMKSGTDPDGNKVLDEKGEPNAPAMSAAIMKHMPLIGQPVLQNIIKTQDDRLKLNDSIRGLGDNYRNDISGIVRSSIGTQDTPDQIGAKLDAYVQQNPNAASLIAPSVARAKSLLGNLGTHVPQEHNDKALLHLAQEFQPASTSVSEQTQNIQSFTTPSGDRGTVQQNPLSPVPMGQVGPQVGQGIPPQIVTPPGGVPTPYKGGGPVPSSYGAGGPAPTSQDVENFGAYQQNLNHRVQVASDLIPRITQAEEALDKIRAGGGSEAYAKFGRMLQATGVVPKSLIDRVSNGDLAATQEAEKYLFQSTFAGLKQSMQGDASRVSEFNAAEQVFPSIGTDPRATKSVLNFMADQSKRDYAEQQALNKARKSGTFNPATWQADYQQQLRAGKVEGVPASQVPRGAGDTGKTVTQAEVDAYAKKHGMDAAKAKAHVESNGFTIK